MNNYQSPVSHYRFKLDTEPSLVTNTAGAVRVAQRPTDDARWSVVMNIYAQVAGGAYHRHILE